LGCAWGVTGVCLGSDWGVIGHLPERTIPRGPLKMLITPRTPPKMSRTPWRGGGEEKVGVGNWDGGERKKKKEVGLNEVGVGKWDERCGRYGQASRVKGGG